MLIHTIRQPWINIGTIDATAGAADAALGVAERDYVSAIALANVVSKVLPLGINSLETRFLLTTNGANVTIDVWAVRLNNLKQGEMARVCTLDVECGTQVTDHATATKYADEIILSNNTAQWPKTPVVIQSGNDTELMARLIFDMCGYDAIVFHGRTTFAEDCIVEISGY